MQKELKNVLEAIDKWKKVNDGDVDFIGSFVSFDRNKIERDEDDITKDVVIIGYGTKASLEIAIEEFSDRLKKEKDFINW